MKLLQGKENVLVIGDLHTPFNHPDSLEFLTALKRSRKPSKVICMGDEVDFHAFSNYAHDPNGYSPGHELDMAVKELKKFYAVFPNVLVCHSNHTERFFKKAMNAGLPTQMLRSYREFLQAPKGWQWAKDWEIDGVLYEHGEGVSGQNAAIKAALANRQSTVIGHVHSYAGVSFNTNRRDSLFGFNVGCLIDDTQYVFAYGASNRVKPGLGAGIVNRGVPEFIPMILDKNGRWTGKL